MRRKLPEFCWPESEYAPAVRRDPRKDCRKRHANIRVVPNSLRTIMICVRSFASGRNRFGFPNAFGNMTFGNPCRKSRAAEKTQQDKAKDQPLRLAPILLAVLVQSIRV
ncbi:hypothetical protein [Pseudochelatococcus contaminans]|uniref:hypothetical protein n=1 Tax=Pseudochelatococcus contaminans TaxID=1538103 RepID=UPI0016097CD1|nr:hypothetical protein [Pseudochelatococcus contaminans]